jgi:hypothetical protein
MIVIDDKAYLYQFMQHSEQYQSFELIVFSSGSCIL